jgi:hypothetical protein
MNWKLWGRGLFAAFIQGAATGSMATLIDPSHFNLFHGGARAFLELFVSSGAIGALLYLKEHPDPWAEFVNKGSR